MEYIISMILTAFCGLVLAYCLYFICSVIYCLIKYAVGRFRWGFKPTVLAYFRTVKLFSPNGVTEQERNERFLPIVFLMMGGEIRPGYTTARFLYVTSTISTLVFLLLLINPINVMIESKQETIPGLMCFAVVFGCTLFIYKIWRYNIDFVNRRQSEVTGVNGISESSYAGVFDDNPADASGDNSTVNLAGILDDNPASDSGDNSTNGQSEIFDDYSTETSGHSFNDNSADNNNR